MEGATLCHKNGNCLCCKPGHHSWYSNQTMDWTVWGSIPITRKRFFFFSKMFILGLRLTQLPIQRVSLSLFLGVKQLGYRPDVSPSSTAEVKKECKYTSSPHSHMYLHSMQRDKFLTFTILCYLSCDPVKVCENYRFIMSQLSWPLTII